MTWTERLTRLEGILPMDRVAITADVNWDLLGIVGMYAFAVVWLVYRWIARGRQGARRRPLEGRWVVDGLVGLLVSVMLMAFVILLALGRAEGRSPYYYSRRL